jgi:hypothetical protein
MLGDLFSRFAQNKGVKKVDPIAEQRKKDEEVKRRNMRT